MDVLELLPLEVCDGLLQLPDAVLGVVGSFLHVDLCLQINNTVRRVQPQKKLMVRLSVEQTCD